MKFNATYDTLPNVVRNMERWIETACQKEVELISGETPWTFSYGTAGFRDKACKLERVVFRVGLLAVLRSKVKKAAVGVVITASHNPVQDNGVKMVDPLGEMLSQDWELYATRLANVSLSGLKKELEYIILETSCDMSRPAHVIVARDTRPSGEKLVGLLQAAVSALSAEISNYGVLTTPQLHYLVRCVNTGGRFGEPTEEGYYKKLVSAFSQLLTPGAKISLKLDGANGVGALKVQKLLQYFRDQSVPVCIDIVNDGSLGMLNEKCGADYVKTSQKAPTEMQFSEEDRCVSFDGDADRIVYFFKEGSNFKLLDGDKIAALVANYLTDLLQIMASDLTVGVVQTAYANGNSTNYLSKLPSVGVSCTKTGVKHLHHKAVEYDVGIYFEANGHGTVLFSERAVATFRAVQETGNTPEIRETAKLLHALTELINQTVGDAIADMLMVEVILSRKNWGCSEWYQMYEDLPSRQLKVSVTDRSVVKTTDFERRCVSPVGLQDEIDGLVQKTPCGRSFIRPSGTEDVVRVYAEAATQEEADELARQVKVKVHQLAGGVGELSQL